jgi:hypothetical protein
MAGARRAEANSNSEIALFVPDARRETKKALRKKRRFGFPKAPDFK